LNQLVHTNKTIGDFINRNYVSLKINGDSLAGKQLREKYQYPGYPTTILLTATGAEIDRIVGFDGDKDEYFQILKNYTAGRQTLTDYLTILTKESNNYDANYAVLKKYEDRNDFKSMQTYAAILLKLDPENNKGKQNELLYTLAYCRYKITGDIAVVSDFIAKCTDDQWIERGYQNIIRHFSKSQDQKRVIATYETALERLPRSTDLMNAYAWYIFQNKVTDHYARGIAVARRAVELEPEADNIWDTLGQLSFAAGEIDEAIRAMQKASTLNPREKSYRQLLKQYRSQDRP